VSLSTWFLSRAPVTDSEVRAEIWSLGARYMGAPLEGALEELAQPGLASERAKLLRACVRKMQNS